MGHDISAYRKARGKDNQAEEVAYIRYGAFNGSARRFYQVLNAQNLDGVVSGIGESREFSRDELFAALTKLSTSEDDERIKEFIDSCLAVGEAVDIYFG